MLIFAILNHPRSFLVYSSNFGVFLSYKTDILWFPSLTSKVSLHVTENESKYCDVAPLRFLFLSHKDLNTFKHYSFYF